MLSTTNCVRCFLDSSYIWFARQRFHIVENDYRLLITTDFATLCLNQHGCPNTISKDCMLNYSNNSKTTLQLLVITTGKIDKNIT